MSRLQRTSRAGWTRWHPVGAAIMAMVGAAATSAAWRDMVHLAIERGQTRHLCLVPVAIAWLIAVRRERIKLCGEGRTWVGPLIVAVAWGISMLGKQAGLEVLWHGGAVGVVIGCVVSVFGAAAMRSFAPALAAALFVVPLPERVIRLVSLPVSELATALVQATLGFGQVTSTEAAAEFLCALLLGFTFAFSSPYRGWVRLVLVIASPAAAVAALLVQRMSYLLKAPAPEQATQVLGWLDWSGWVLVPLTLLLLGGLRRMLRWAALPLHHYKLADEA